MKMAKTVSNNTSRLLNILIVGTGRMAGEHARRYQQIDGVKVLAAVDVNSDRVNNFCDEHGIGNAYTDLALALSKHQFDACSVVTPDAWHAPVANECLNASLPVLCEKPLSDSLTTGAAMVSTAAASNQLTMVNLSYRTSGALHEARKLVDSGALGEIRHVEASYRQGWLASDYWGDWKTDDAWLWRLSKDHGSLGVLGDVGIHILDFACSGVGQDITGLQCRLKTFDKAPENRIGEYKLDANDSCVMNVEFSKGAMGVVHMSRYYTGYMNDLSLSIHGTLGAVIVSTGSRGDQLQASLGEDMHAQNWVTMSCEDQPDTFERFVTSVQSGVSTGPDFFHAYQLQKYLSLGFDSHASGRWVSV